MGMNWIVDGIITNLSPPVVAGGSTSLPQATTRRGLRQQPTSLTKLVSLLCQLLTNGVTASAALHVGFDYSHAQSATARWG